MAAPENLPALTKAVEVQPRIMIVPSQLQSIVSFVLEQAWIAHLGAENEKEHIMKLCANRFLPDITPYHGKIFVNLGIQMRGGDVCASFLTTPADWELITHGTHSEAFNLGEIHGKHSEVKLGYSDNWEVSIEKDPYEIARLVSEHGDSLPAWIEDYLEQFPEEAEDLEE